MASVRFIKKIKNYAIISFILPLLAINSCFLIYKFLGNFDYRLYSNLNWSKNEHSYKFSEYNLLRKNTETYTFTNCPTYQRETYYITIDNQTLLSTGILEYGFESKEFTLSKFFNIKDSILLELEAKNQIKTVLIKHNQIPTSHCIKKDKFLYSLLK